MKKKVIAAMLCLSMVAVGLAGCGSSSDEGKAEGDGGKDGEVVKLRMMAYNAENTRASYLNIWMRSCRTSRLNLNSFHRIISITFELTAAGRRGTGHHRAGRTDKTSGKCQLSAGSVRSGIRIQIYRFRITAIYSRRQSICNAAAVMV